MTARIGLLGTSADCEVLEGLLAGEGDVVVLDDASAQAAVRAGELALLVVSPDGDWWRGIDRMTALQAAARHPVTMMALVPRGDSAALAFAFDQGVADCAAYPIDRAEVRTRVRALLRRKQVADHLRAEATEARRLAHTDPLTGLWNRNYLETELEESLLRSQVTRVPLALLMIDIDAFKPVNDRHGHAAGDGVLKAIGVRINANIRGIDTLARVGGDELVVVMPEIGMAVARTVAERLRALVADTPVFGSLSVTVSIGVAETVEGEDSAQLLARAD
ncbi:MAG: diguanylate cyclase, partial [Janthinobacterium lividum]